MCSSDLPPGGRAGKERVPGAPIRAGGRGSEGQLSPSAPRFATPPGGRTKTPRASVRRSRLGRRACTEPPAWVPGPQGPRAPRVQTQPVERPGDSGVDLFGVTLTPALRLSGGHESLRPRPTARVFPSELAVKHIDIGSKTTEDFSIMFFTLF